MENIPNVSIRRDAQRIPTWLHGTKRQAERQQGSAAGCRHAVMKRRKLAGFVGLIWTCSWNSQCCQAGGPARSITDSARMDKPNLMNRPLLIKCSHIISLQQTQSLCSASHIFHSSFPDSALRRSPCPAAQGLCTHQSAPLIVLAYPNCRLLIKCSTLKLLAPWLIWYRVGAKHTGRSVAKETW